MSDDEKFYFDWWKHEDQLFTSRGNFFLVANSLLMAAYSQSSAAGHKGVVLCLFGVFISALWIAVSWFQRKYVVVKLREELRKTENHWGRLQEDRCSLTRPHILMGYVLPGSFAFLWIVMLIM